LPDDVSLKTLDSNYGWGRAFNFALTEWLEKEDTSYCITCAHDAQPVGNCIIQLRDALSANPRAGIACPEYGIPEVPQYSPVRGARLVPVVARPMGTVEDVAFAHGTLTMFRRECLEQIGLFDPRHFAYGDETEIGIRAKRLGWSVVLVWGAVLINPGSATAKPLLGYLWTRNSLLMARQFGGLLASLTRALLIVVNSVRLLLIGRDRAAWMLFRARLLAVSDYYLGHFGQPVHRF
jgi:N-acetylglucosaminyl-diphospho-decaprenol L-rhamnosyltransferase